MAIRDELDQLLDQCLGEDPRAALVAVRRLLGRSRQAVRERYRTFVPATAPAPGPPDPALGWYRMHDGFRRLREWDADHDQIAW